MERGDRTFTFLFTDIEGSTRLWEEHEPEMEPVLARHDALIRAAVEGAGGHLFKHTGDGVAAAFDDPGDAVVAALTAQRSLQAAEWGSIGTLRARMGIHTGHALQRGDDYFGRSLNRTARLMDSAHGGQVVVSHTSAELLSSTTNGWTIRDLGLHRLRDLGEPEHVLQLCCPDLPDSFPPLRTVDAAPRRLPAMPETFVGRGREIEELAGLLDHSRVVTVSGPGGVGKTQLAIAVAHQHLGRFPDGVWFVNVRRTGDADQVAELLSTTMALHPAGALAPVDRLVAGVGSRRSLLILDGAEDVAAGVKTVVAQLAAECPGVTTLVTSRELLRARGEQALALAPLALPDPTQPELEAAIKSPAVALFEARARQADAGFEVTADNIASVVEICERVDGLPLAVELAAAQMGMFDPRDLASRLGRRVSLIDDREETLATIVEWSYDSLSADERALFARLSVFAGRFGLPMAEEVCSGDGVHADDVMPLLRGLVDKSVVSHTPSSHGARYRLLAVLREYGRERLSVAGELERIRRRHFDAYLRLAQEADIGLRGSREADWVGRISLEFENLQAAYAEIMMLGDTEGALALVRACQRFALGRLRYEPSTWAADIVAVADPATPGLGAAVALTGSSAAIAGDFEGSIRLGRQAVELEDRDGGEHPFLALRIQAIGSILAGRPAEAVAIAANARGRAERLGRPEDDIEFAALAALAMMSLDQRHEAQVLVTDAIERARDIRNPSLLGWCLYVGGVAHYDATESVAMFDEAIEYAEMVDNLYVKNNALLVATWRRGQIGAGGQAAAGFLQVINHWFRVANWTNLDAALRMCCETFADGEHDELVAVIIGWLGRSDTTDSGLLRPDDRFGAAIADVRARLGDEAFDAARHRGQMMDASALVAHCRSNLTDSASGAARIA